MKQRIVKPLLVALALIVGVVVGVTASVAVVRQFGADLVAGNCNSRIVDEYVEVRDSVMSEISDPNIARHDCEDGGYPVLEFKLRGTASEVLDTLQCASVERWTDSVVYRCRSPRIGYLDVKNDGSATYNFGS